MEETFEIADYVYFIANGKIGAEGTPDDLNRSSDPFVRQFLDASPEGPVPFNYPGVDAATDFGVRSSWVQNPIRYLVDYWINLAT